MLPLPYASSQMRERIARIGASYRQLTGRQLAPDDRAETLWQAARVIVAHDTAADPIFFFGNAAALACFEVSLDSFLAMPSRLSAEPGLREARQAALERVAQTGFFDGYSGVRISAKGRRFHIRDATIWNLVDVTGVVHGQAATFER